MLLQSFRSPALLGEPARLFGQMLRGERQAHVIRHPAGLSLAPNPVIMAAGPRLRERSVLCGIRVLHPIVRLTLVRFGP